MSSQSAGSMLALGRDTGTDRFSRARATATSPGHSSVVIVAGAPAVAGASFLPAFVQEGTRATTLLELRPRANSPPIGGVLHQCPDLRDPLSTWLAAIDLGHAGLWGLAAVGWKSGHRSSEGLS
jgi:hypothetical protein